jgi:gliding motility-associated-like protein
MVGDNTFLQGKWLEVGVAPNGCWGNTMPVPAGYHTRPGSVLSGYPDPITGVPATGNGLDFSYDKYHDGWGTGVFYGAYFLPGTPFLGWSMQVDGVRSDAFYTNGPSGGFSNRPGGTLTGTNVGYSNSGGIISGTWQGTAGVGSRLLIRQTTRVDTLASWAVVTTVFKNTGVTDYTGLYYQATGDPDNDETVVGGSGFTTTNRVTIQGDYYQRRLVSAYSQDTNNVYSALATKDCRAKAYIYTAWPPDTSADNNLDLVWAGTATGIGATYYVQGDVTRTDIAYGMIYNIGTVRAGDSAIISYAWLFRDSLDIDSAFPQPKIVTAGVAHDSLDTVVGCDIIGSTFPVDIVFGEDKCWSWADWSWAPAAGLSATTGAHVIVNLGGLSGPTTYTVTGTNPRMGDCARKTFLLYVTPCFSAWNNGPLCPYDTLRLYCRGGDSVGATYWWTGPGGFTSTLQYPVIPNLPPSDSGLYTVIKTVGGISDTETTRVIVNILPTTIVTSNAPICSGRTLSLNVTPAVTGETFDWTGPNLFTSTLQNPTRPGVFVTDSGLYRVIYSIGRCKDTGFVRVVIDSTPVIPIALNNSPLCTGDMLLLTSSTLTAGVTYLWSGPAGFTSTMRNPLGITGATAANTGIYTVTVTLGRCSATDTTYALIKPNPPLPVLGSLIPLCSGNPLNLTATDTPGCTYYWTGPNGFTSVLQNPIIDPASTRATGTYSVVATLNGCVSPMATIYVLVDSTPVIPTLVASNSPICAGDTLFLTASSPTSGISYVWTGPLSFYSPLQNTFRAGTTTAASGVYTVTVTLGTCTSYTVIPVLVKPTPVMTTLTSNAPICSGNTLNLTTTFSPAGGDYEWSGPNGFSSTLQNPSINPAHTPATGIYSVTETLNGCMSEPATLYVQIDSTPEVPVATSNSPGAPGMSICKGDTLKLFATDATPGVRYYWQGPDLFTSSLQNPMILNVPLSATGVYTVTAILGACATSAITTVTITPTPSITATSNSPVCTGIGDTLFLQAVSGIGATFTWTGPYTFRSGAQNPIRTPVIKEYAGVYTVTGYLNGCYATVFDTVEVRETPPTPWISWLTYCQYYDAPPLMASGQNILWYPSPGMTGSVVPPVPSTNTVGRKFYYATQTVEGCTSAIDSIQVTVYPKPSITFLSADTAICPHDSVVLRVINTDPIAYYKWRPGLYLTDSTSATITVRPETNIKYSVVTSNQFGCTDTAFVAVNVYPAAVLGVVDSVTIYPGESYQINTQTNCTSFYWFPPSGLSDIYSSNPVAAPELSTRYFVNGRTAWGCSADDSIDVLVSLESLINLPNAFVPGNGPNGKFKVVKKGIATLSGFDIFDRWGVKVFSTTDIDAGWDGTYKGAAQPQGVYIYQITGATSAGTPFVKKGNITLLR